MLDTANPTSFTGYGHGLIELTITLAMSLSAMAFILLRMRETFLFAASNERDGGKAMRQMLRSSARNALGICLIFVGLLMTLPGVPGTGWPAAICGLVVLEVGELGKLKLRVLSAPPVLAVLNRLRSWFGHQPISAPAAAHGPSDLWHHRPKR